MINPEELLIWRKRGHEIPGLMTGTGWIPCAHCGMWIREVATIEEREDEPPSDEIDPLFDAERIFKRIEKQKPGTKPPPA